MRMEGDRDAVGPARPRLCQDARENRLVATMDAVEVSEGDDGRGEASPMRRDVADQLHDGDEERRSRRLRGPRDPLPI